MPLILLELLDTQDDRDAVERIYKTYKQLIFTIAFDILKDEQSAEDAVMETFIRFIQNYSDDNSNCNTRTRNYLVTIARNYCYDQIKTQHDFDAKEIEQYVDGSVNLNDDPVFSEVSFDELKELFKALPDIYADILYLAYVEGKSTQEIAVIFSISRENARKRLERARNMYMKEIKRHHE